MDPIKKLITATLLFTLMLLITLCVQASLPFPRGNLTYSFALVEISNGTFVPDNVSVYKNATVVWVNRDLEPHVLFIGGRCTPTLFHDESYTMNFHEFGRYSCFYDDNRRSHGIVIVR
ncbi:MAG TPA: hypothetical protein VK436_08710 [Methanocella sp.]|nr:hypothetical protein [Methanocella sp.]